MNLEFQELQAIHDKKETRITPKAGQYRLATLTSDGRQDYGNLFAAAPEMLAALKLVHKAICEAHVLDVKKRWDLCVASAAVSKAIFHAETAASDIGQVGKP